MNRWSDKNQLCLVLVVWLSLFYVVFYVPPRQIAMIFLSPKKRVGGFFNWEVLRNMVFMKTIWNFETQQEENQPS